MSSWSFYRRSFPESVCDQSEVDRIIIGGWPFLSKHTHLLPEIENSKTTRYNQVLLKAELSGSMRARAKTRHQRGSPVDIFTGQDQGPPATLLLLMVNYTPRLSGGESRGAHTRHFSLQSSSRAAADGGPTVHDDIMT